MALLKNFYVSLKDTAGGYYKLRKQMLSAVKIIYRIADSGSDFTETYDYNVDESANDGNGWLWIKLPYGDLLEVSVCVNVGPLRTIQTKAVKFDTTIMGGLETTAYPAPLNSLQGYSPRIADDGEWLQYDDERQTFTGTGIYAKNTTGGTHPIVDVIQVGNMSGVTSNQVGLLKQTYDQSISNMQTVVNNLNAHKISVKVNDTTTQEDADGLIDLGDLQTEAYNSANTRMVTATSEVINDVTVPRGSLVATTAYPNADKEQVVALSSPHNFYSCNCNTDEWYRLFVLGKSVKLDVTVTVYSSVYIGEVFIERNGYDWKVTTTSEYLKNCIKVYHYGIMAYLVVKGSQYVGYNVSVEAYGQITFLGNTDTIDENRLTDMDLFLTHYEESSDWANITASPYTVSASDLTVLNYNVVGLDSVDFTFADELDYPLTLRFVATEDDTVVNVTDSTNEWTGTSSAMTKGQVGVFQFISKDSYNWSYTVQNDYEQVSNKVQEITSENSASTNNYASLYALTKWTDEHGGVDNAITSNTITNLEKPSFGYGIDNYITWDNVNMNPDGTIGYYWCNLGWNDIKMTVGYNPNANAVNRFQVNDIITLNEKDVVLLNGTKHGWSSKHETGSTGTVDWEGFDLGTMQVKVNGNTYSADTENVIDLGTIGGGKEIDYDFVFTGTQSGTVANQVDLTDQQPRNNYYLKIDSSSNWDTVAGASIPSLTVSAYTYTGESLVVEVDDESTGTTVGGVAYKVNNFTLQIYNYQTGTLQQVYGFTTVASEKQNVYVLNWDTENQRWTVTSQSSGDKGDYCKTLEVGNQTYNSDNGIISTPDYAKAVSAITYLSANTSLHLSHINGNSENVQITPHDIHDKFDNAGYILTIPSTEGADKAICMCNFGSTSGRYFKVHIEYLGQGADTEMRVTDGAPLITTSGDLEVYKDGSSHSVYLKVNSTAETVAYMWLEDATKADDITVYIASATSQSFLMGRTKEITATTPNQIRDWKSTFVKTNVVNLNYELDSTNKTLKMTDTDGVEQTLNLSTITFTI